MAEAPASPLVQLFGETVQGKDGPVATSSLAECELIGVYFSAHWCGPCKNFTPRLVDTYNTLKSNGKKFEILFVSADRDEEAYTSYYGEMPWLSVGYESDVSKELNKKFRVQGIPTLAFVDPATGKTITKDGRSAVSNDPNGEEFPWTPKSFWEIFTGDLQRGVGDSSSTVSSESLREGYIAIYFSAHWCPPCRGFTPQLIEWYNSHKNSFDTPFELVFASSDRDENAFNEYFGEMPWLAVPFSDRKRKEALSNHFNVQGIPTFVIVDGRTGKTITTKARGGVTDEPEGFPWKEKAYGILNNSFLENLNEMPCLVLFADDDGKSLVPFIEHWGNEYTQKAEAGDGELEMSFLVVSKTDQFRGRIQKLMGVEDDVKMCVLVIPEGKCAVSSETNLTQETIDAFVQSFVDENVEMKSLQRG